MWFVPPRILRPARERAIWASGTPALWRAVARGETLPRAIAAQPRMARGRGGLLVPRRSRALVAAVGARALPGRCSPSPPSARRPRTARKIANALLIYVEKRYSRLPNQAADPCAKGFMDVSKTGAAGANGATSSAATAAEGDGEKRHVDRSDEYRGGAGRNWRQPPLLITRPQAARTCRVATPGPGGLHRRLAVYPHLFRLKPSAFNFISSRLITPKHTFQPLWRQSERIPRIHTAYR